MKETKDNYHYRNLHDSDHRIQKKQIQIITESINLKKEDDRIYAHVSKSKISIGETNLFAIDSTSSFFKAPGSSISTT